MTDPKDPRNAQGGWIKDNGKPDPHGQNNVTINMTNAVLLDGLNVAMVGAVKDGTVGKDPLIALSLAGRINKTKERSEVLYVMDPEGAAAICADLIGVMGRMGRGEEFVQLLDSAIARLP